MHSKNYILSNYKIKKISEVDKDLLSSFYKKTYKQRYKSLTNNWRWWYRVGYNNFEPLIVLLDDKVIGQAAYLPTDLNILEKKLPAIWFVDYATLPEFIGKGLGKVMYKEWSKICPNQMAICSVDSLRVLKKSGWMDNYDTKRLAKPINIFNFLPIIRNLNLNFANRTLRYFMKKKINDGKNINIYNINENFKILSDAFKMKIDKKNDKLASIIRDEQWLYWRLMECPYKKDIYFFEYKNNFAIVHIFFNNVKRLNILYTYSTEEPQENELYLKITNWAINNNIDLLWAINSSAKLENTFPKFFNKPLKFASWSKDEKVLNILKNGLLDLQGIDTDTDSCTYVE